MISCRNADDVISLFELRKPKCFPTAPLHSSGTTVGGYDDPTIYVGWEFKADKKLENAWRKFLKSDESDLKDMVPDLKGFLAEMESTLSDFNEDGGDDEDGGEQVGGIGFLALFIKLKQQCGTDNKKYAHLFTSTEVMGENSDTGNQIAYKSVILGVALKNSWKQQELAAAIEEATKELVAKFPDRDASEITISIASDYSEGNCY